MKFFVGLERGFLSTTAGGGTGFGVGGLGGGV
jgi:hypothetical protein